MSRKTSKALLAKSLDVLIEKAGDCADLAKAQRAGADKQHEGANRQHESARNLEELSKTLVENAVAIKGEEIEGEPRPPRSEQPRGAGTPRARSAIPK